MEWTDSLSVGVYEIAAQHKELIDKVNTFYETIKVKKLPQDAVKMLDYLSQYVLKHFADEERLQVKVGYPGYAEHKKLHDAFIKTVEEIRQSIREEGVTTFTSSRIAMTVSNWLVSHISMQDRKLGNYINSL